LSDRYNFNPTPEDKRRHGSIFAYFAPEARERLHKQFMNIPGFDARNRFLTGLEKELKQARKKHEALTGGW